MTTKTTESARKTLDSIRAHNEGRGSRLRAAVEEAEDRGHLKAIEKARKELADFEALSNNAIARAESNLREAEEADRAHLEKKAAAEKQLADTKEANAKRRAFRAFLDAGGRREDFESEWPAMWEAILHKAATGGRSEEGDPFGFSSL